jgi:hypothetical protein
MAQLAPPVECRSGGSAYDVVDPLFDAFTKRFTALAVLKLRDANKVVLDAPVAKWVPELANTRYPSTDSRDIRARDCSHIRPAS